MNEITIKSKYLSSYEKQLAEMLEEFDENKAFETVVGGYYEEVGNLEVSLLKTLGLKPTDTIVDVGTGSGRLPVALGSSHTGAFYGTDILEPALDYARKRCGRTDWEFCLCESVPLPFTSGIADYVTFFSVFTHIIDEDVYRYLCEANRLIKKNGHVVFSFLDYELDAHWGVFTSSVKSCDNEAVLNRLTTKNALMKLVRAAGLRLVNIYDGTHPWIKSDSPDLSCFGQSVAVAVGFDEEIYFKRYPDVLEAVKRGEFSSGAHHYDVCGIKENRLGE